jgi:hypothetical protein
MVCGGCTKYSRGGGMKNRGKILRMEWRFIAARTTVFR